MKRPKTPTFYTVELREVDGLYRAYVHALAVSCSASSPVRASSQIEHDLADVLMSSCDWVAIYRRMIRQTQVRRV